MAEAWPPGSRRVYHIGVLTWVVILQPLAFIADLILPAYWPLWHLLATILGLAIGHVLTMRVMALAIQEWKNRV